jgi:hypothetical protein
MKNYLFKKCLSKLPIIISAFTVVALAFTVSSDVGTEKKQ